MCTNMYFLDMKVIIPVCNLIKTGIANKFFEISLQTVIAEVNQKIGADGVVSQQCKAVVAQYGETIMNMILAKVLTIIL